MIIASSGKDRNLTAYEACSVIVDFDKRRGNIPQKPIIKPIHLRVEAFSENKKYEKKKEQSGEKLYSNAVLVTVRNCRAQ